MMKKNDLVILEISAITNEGNGVGRHEGMAVFVPMTAPGDTIRARIVKTQKSYCYGMVEELLVPSPQRIEPDCPVFRRCGGCSLRQLDYRCELEQKQQWVTDAVRRIGGLDTPVLPILPSPAQSGYRNKAQYPFGRGADGKVCCGFYAQRTHTLIPGEDCRLQPGLFGALCRVVCGYIDSVGGSLYDEITGQGLFRHLYLRRAEATEQVMVALVINGNDIPEPERLTKALLDGCPGIQSILLNHNTRQTNVILGERNTLLWGEPVITDLLCGIQVELSPLSFYQVNRQGAEQLYGVAGELADLQEGQLLLDLYCGAGTIGLSMVRGKPATRLIGVEIVAAAVENAKRNAKRAGLDNTEFIVGDAGTAAAALTAQGLRPHVVVVDPPRKGCDLALLEAILDMNPQRIVMISCNPATMARDIKLLWEKGYIAQAVHPVDMFPRTNHVECVVRLDRKRL